MIDYVNLRCFRLSKTGKLDRSSAIIMGIDEAGRGPVLGPMVYGGFYCPLTEESKNVLKNRIRVDDSKKLTESSREDKFVQLIDQSLPFGICADVITPQYISYKMLQRSKYNLNEISHDTAISLIRHVLSLGWNLKEVYIDAVGQTSKYEAKLKRIFPNIRFIVAEKADSIYPTVSAASIVAKVIRDSMIKHFNNNEVGSGYPGATTDSITREYLSKSMHKIFGFSEVVRFSWSTASSMLTGPGTIKVEWYDDEEDSIFKDTKRSLPKSLNSTIKRITKL